MALVASNAALADGFECITLDESVIVKVYHHVDASNGTRNGSVMIVSDPSIQVGRRTIASFTDVKGTLDNSGAAYSADVDLRMVESRRGGENIGGTKLRYLDSIELVVDFSYATPVAEGEELASVLHLVKRDGDVISKGAVCTRYLKQ